MKPVLFQNVRLLSKNAARILALFLASPGRPLYGYELMQSTGIKSGSLYPVLGRFETLGWVTGQMEPSPGGRPPRRVYKMVPESVDDAQAALDRYFGAKEVPRQERLSWGLL